MWAMMWGKMWGGMWGGSELIGACGDWPERMELRIVGRVIDGLPDS
jgi:hypothetical protein